MINPFSYHMFADDGINRDITPLSGVPELDGLVIGTSEDVRTTRDIAATSNYTFMRLEQDKPQYGTS